MQPYYVEDKEPHSKKDIYRLLAIMLALLAIPLAVWGVFYHMFAMNMCAGAKGLSMERAASKCTYYESRHVAFAAAVFAAVFFAVVLAILSLIFFIIESIIRACKNVARQIKKAYETMFEDVDTVYEKVLLVFSPVIYVVCLPFTFIGCLSDRYYEFMYDMGKTSPCWGDYPPSIRSNPLPLKAD